MNSNLVIGVGTYGHYLVKKMAELNCQVMVIDVDESHLEDVLDIVVSAKVGDCTKEEVLRELDIESFDNVYVCMSENFQNSLEITSLVKEMGAKHVISIADREIQAKFLSRNGADVVLYPDRDSAFKAAKMGCSKYIVDYIGVNADYGIIEAPILNPWVGKSIRNLEIRAKHSISVLGIIKGEEKIFNPSADYVFEANDKIYFFASDEEASEYIANVDAQQ